MMPDDIDLGYAFTLAPEKAVEYFESKGHRISWNWWETWQEAHARAFTVARATRLDVLNDIRGAVDGAIRDGTTFRDFRRQLEPTLQRKGWWGKLIAVDGSGEAEVVQLGSVRRLRTIYSTNLQTAYMAGRWNGMVENAQERPYWMYVAINDAQTRPEHAALHGQVFRWDDPIWQSLYPPNDWGCRCRVRALTEKQVEARGIAVQSSEGKLGESLELVTKRTGELQPVATYDLGGGRTFKTGAGWSYNPGAAHWQPDLDKYPYETARQYVEGMLTGPSFNHSYSRVERLVSDALAQGIPRRQVRAHVRPYLSGNHWPVAVAAPLYMERMRAKYQSVLISDDTLVKQLLARDSGLGMADYRHMQSTMDNALLVVQERDGLHHLFFSSDEKMYRAVVKKTRRGELFLQSYHRANEAQMNRAPDRGTVLIDRRGR